MDRYENRPGKSDVLGGFIIKKRANNSTEISGVWNAVFVLILFAAVIITVVPLINVIIVSFSHKDSFAIKGYSFFPTAWSLEGYRYLFRFGQQLWRGYIVSIVYSISGTLLSLTLMSTYAYVLWQRNFPARRFFTWYMFVTMLFSGGLVPSYIIITQYLHINDSFLIFLFNALVSGYSVIILRTFLKTTIQESLVEAALIDGAGHFRIFIQIVLPLFKAGLATIGLFGVVARWNDWFTAVLYINKPELTPLQTVLYRMQEKVAFLVQNAAFASTPDGQEMIRTLPSINLNMACAVATVIPILIAYPFFQQFFQRGLLVGSIKE